MTQKGSEVVSLVPRDSGEGTLEFTCVRPSVRACVVTISQPLLNLLDPKLACSTLTPIPKNCRSPFFKLGPPPPSRPKIVFSIQIHLCGAKTDVGRV